METTIKLAQMKDRANRLANSSKNVKAPGVLKKLRRQIRAIEKSLS